MKIAKKASLFVLFFLTSLSQSAKSVSRDQIDTGIQVIGTALLWQGSNTFYIGRKLIEHGYKDLYLSKMPSHLKTPRAMKKFGALSMITGLATVLSPLLFTKAEELGKKYREQKETTSENLNESLLDESLVVI